MQVLMIAVIAFTWAIAGIRSDLGMYLLAVVLTASMLGVCRETKGE